MATSAWTDVGELVDAGTAQLLSGELLKSSTFRHARSGCFRVTAALTHSAHSMFEAMSAVQMMEPRMDVGMDASGCRSLEQSLASGAAPQLPTVEQTLEVVEGLLVRHALGGCSSGAHFLPRSRSASSPGRRATRWQTPA